MASFSGFTEGESALLNLDDGKRELVDETKAKELLERALAGRDITTIKRVRLSNKSYDGAAAAVIAATLKLATSVEEVDFSDMIAGRHEDIGLEVLTTICGAVADRQLTLIDLSDNAMGEKGINACRAALTGQRRLLSLALCNDGLSASAMEAVRDILLATKDSDVAGTGEAGKKTAAGLALQRLHFFNNMSGDGGAKALAQILPHCPDLVDFRFSGTRAGSSGSLAVAEALAACPAAVGGKFVKLDLADNTMGEAGGRALVAVLDKQKGLVSLNLRDCSLEDDGMTLVMQALAKVKTPGLTHIDLSANELTSESMVHVCRCIKGKKALTHLALEENEIKTSGAKKVAGAMKGLPALCKVVMSQNEIGTAGAVALVKALDNKTSLTCLELNANCLDEDGLTHVSRMLESYGKLHVLGEMDDNDADFEEDDEEEEDEEEEEEEEEVEEEGEEVIPEALGGGAAISLDDLTEQLAEVKV